jgi:polysaccharide pyruvyl transferase WcaK-like protein
LFSVRNSGTRRELVDRGCAGDKIEVVPDSGMFAKAKKISVPGLDKTKLKIGFNWTTDRENQTFPAPFEENKNKFIDACCGLLNYAIKERNARVFYIGHMGNEFDRNIINALKEKIAPGFTAIEDVLPGIYPPSVEKAGFIVDVYRQMDVVLGMRGHSNIVSFGQNVPMIGIGSHRKIRYFLEDVGRSEYFFDVRPGEDMYSLPKMTNILDRVIDDIPGQRVSIKKEKAKQKILFDKFNAKLLKLLD